MTPLSLIGWSGIFQAARTAEGDRRIPCRQAKWQRILRTCRHLGCAGHKFMQQCQRVVHKFPARPGQGIFLNPAGNFSRLGRECNSRSREFCPPLGFMAMICRLWKTRSAGSVMIADRLSYSRRKEKKRQEVKAFWRLGNRQSCSGCADGCRHGWPRGDLKGRYSRNRRA